VDDFGPTFLTSECTISRPRNDSLTHREKNCTWAETDNLEDVKGFRGNDINKTIHFVNNSKNVGREFHQLSLKATAAKLDFAVSFRYAKCSFRVGLHKKSRTIFSVFCVSSHRISFDLVKNHRFILNYLDVRTFFSQKLVQHLTRYSC
jgi:hypothetical protein